MKNLFHLFLILIFPLALMAQDQKPNVLIVFIDDLGYGDLGCYGNRDARTKNIDALASRGTRFEQFYSNSPVCSPSRVAMLTGQYPAKHKIYTYLADRKKNKENNMPDYLPASVFTMAKMLKANGYATAHYGKWHLGGGRDVADAPLPTEYGFDRSFTSFEGLGNRTLHGDDNLNRQSARLGRGKIIAAPQHKQTELYVDSILNFLKENKEQPVFVNFWLNDVHDPYNPAPGSAEKYRSATEDKEQQKFLAVLEQMDIQLGRIVDELEQSGRLNNTVIFLTSDNGPTDWPFYYKDGGSPPCSAGDLRGRKWSLYEGGIRSPLIAFLPGKIPAGVLNTKSVISVVDLLPTIAALTNSRLPPNYRSDGRNELEQFTGISSQKKKEIYWYYNNNPLPGKAENISPKLALRSRNWKLLMEPDGSELQLYDIIADQTESRNLAPAYSRKTKQLSRKLLRWYKARNID